jgi:hypothetical protein
MIAIGLSTINNYIEKEIGTLIKLVVLLYADDTVLLAETPEGLQYALNKFEEYCTLWKLQIHLSKAKVMIFSRGYIKKKLVFSIGNVNLDIVNEYLYLGVLFSGNGRFCKAIKRIINQASKAMFNVFRIIRKLEMPIDIKQTTPDYIVYGELGRYPLSILAKVRQIKWWGKVLSSDSKLVNYSIQNYGYYTK